MLTTSIEIPFLRPPSVKSGPYPTDPYETSISQLLLGISEIKRADIALIGVPFDGGTVFRPGCRLGPRAVREAFMSYTTYNPDIDIDISKLNIIDAGDVDVLNTDIKESLERIEKVVTEIFKLKVTPIIVGGDHLISYPCVKALCKHLKGNIGVVVFDAHYDVRTSTHSEVSSGTPFRKILEEIPGQRVKPRNLVEIGIQGFRSSITYKKYVDAKGIHVFTISMIHDMGIESVTRQAIEYAKDGTEAIYVSVDIDVLDQSFAPGTTSPNIGGLTTREVLDAIFQLGKEQLVKAFDLIGVSPPFDVANLTARLAGGIILQAIGGFAARLPAEIR